MARKDLLKAKKPRGHRFLIEMNGLTNEEAARFYVALIAVAEASKGERGHASSNVPIGVLRDVAPDDEWLVAYVPGKIRWPE